LLAFAAERVIVPSMMTDAIQRARLAFDGVGRGWVVSLARVMRVRSAFSGIVRS
jgi:hypothetical protein